jgi:hypothetical protein
MVGPGETVLTILPNTFRHFRGISGRRELELWGKGVLTWDDLRRHLSPQRPLFVNNHSRDAIVRQIEKSQNALPFGDIAYFATS